MLKLPPEKHPVRAFITSEQLESLKPERMSRAAALVYLPTVPEARKQVKAWFDENGKSDRPRNVLAINGEGRVILLAIGSKGGYKVRWNFGHP